MCSASQYEINEEAMEVDCMCFEDPTMTLAWLPAHRKNMGRPKTTWRTMDEKKGARTPWVTKELGGSP